MDDEGVVYTYDELYGSEEEPENLAKLICDWAMEGDEMPNFVSFAHSFDAAASKKTATMGANVNSVNNRMIPTLRKYGIPDPHESTRDKLGRDTLMRERLRKRIRLGEDAEEEPEKIEATTDGTDSPLQGAGYGLYAIFGRPAAVPKAVQLQKVLADAPDKTAEYLRALRFEKQWQNAHPARGRNPVRWRRQSS